MNKMKNQNIEKVVKTKIRDAYDNIILFVTMAPVLIGICLNLIRLGYTTDRYTYLLLGFTMAYALVSAGICFLVRLFIHKNMFLKKRFLKKYIIELRSTIAQKSDNLTECIKERNEVLYEQIDKLIISALDRHKTRVAEIEKETSETEENLFLAEEHLKTMK